MNTHCAQFSYAGLDEPHHARATRERVAYCVAEEMRQAVAAALRLGNFEPVGVSLPDTLSALLEDQHCVALVHDLHPWDLSGAREIEEVRREHPGLPILVYAPNRVGIADLLLRCACLHGVRAELQQTFSAREADRLRSLIVSFIDDGARARVLQMIQSVDPDAPTRAWTFIDLALRTMGRQTTTERLTVAQLANRLGVSQRTLERSWRIAALPPPKELLEWLALLLSGLLSAQSGITVARAARKLGLDSQQLYRFRQRLLPDVLRSAREDFETVFLAFVGRCRRSTAHALAFGLTSSTKDLPA